MPKFQFAGTRAKACVHSIQVETGGSITAAIAGNWKFYLQFRNRAGYSLMSDPVSVTLATGNKIEVTIPADARRDGEHIEEWVISGTNLSEFNVDAKVLCSVPAFDALGNPTILPHTVTLSSDEHFQLEASVATESALPSDKLHGMRRGVDSTGQILAWNSLTEAWEEVLPPRFTSYVPSAEGAGGANRDVGLLPTDYQGVTFPDYDSGNLLPVRGTSVGYWLCNDTDFDIPVGTPIDFTFRAGKYTDFSGKIIITPKGYADIATGHLDRSGEGGAGLYDGIDQDFIYQQFTGEIVLEKNLPPGRAYYFEITPQFTDAQLGNLISQGKILTVYAEFGIEKSAYAPGTLGLKDYIYPDPPTRKRIYPAIGILVAEASPGAGLVKQREFRRTGSELILGFAENTADQQVVISGDGVCFVSAIAPPYTVRRALVGTVDGVGKPTAFQYSLAVDSNKAIRLNIIHPTTIRADYPDLVAGSGLGDFNASKVYVYVRNTTTGEIQRFIQEIIPGSTSSNFAIGGTAGVVVPFLPSSSVTFGLYEPVSFTATTENAGSSFTSATVEVAIAYFFEKTVTSLNHITGCISEDSPEQVSNLTENMMLINFAF